MLSKTDILLVTAAVIVAGGWYYTARTCTSYSPIHVTVPIPQAKALPDDTVKRCTPRNAQARPVNRYKQRSQGPLDRVPHRFAMGRQVMEPRAMRNGKGGVERLHSRKGSFGTMPAWGSW